MGSGPLTRRLALAPLLLAACQGWEATEEDGLAVFRRVVRAGADGTHVARIEVAEGDRALLLTAAHDPDALVHVDLVQAPDGEVVYRASDWWDAPRNKTNGGFASDVTTLNWPVDTDDAPLTPGTWRVTLGTDTPGPFDLSVALKSDADLGAGRLVAEVIYAGNVADDPRLVRGIEEALVRWRDGIYAPIGIEVELRERSWGGPARLASPGFGDREPYLDAVGDKDLRVVPIVIARRVTDGPAILGVSGGIPGPLEGTDRSAVVVSALLAAGGDAVIDGEEIDLLAETIGHEVGHYLGLFHPVELPRRGDGAATAWDALPDTPECHHFEDHCVPLLAGNLMFPTPVCAVAFDEHRCFGFVRQLTLTPYQRAVMHRYVGVE